MGKGDKRWGVYALVWEIDDGGKRVYVGGSTNLSNRWRSYRANAKRGILQSKLQALWDQVGEPTFNVVQVVPTGDLDRLAEREAALIRTAIDRVGRSAVLNAHDKPKPADYGLAAYLQAAREAAGGSSVADSSPHLPDGGPGPGGGVGVKENPASPLPAEPVP